MDLKKLDYLLRKLSDSEIGYKNGTKAPMWSEDILSGQLVPRLSLHHLPYEADMDSLSNSTFHVVLKELDISINRNSRYCPVPKHTHDHIEISYVYSGTCPQTIGYTDISLLKGQVLIIDTSFPHSIGLLEEDDIMINLLMSKEYLHNNLYHHLSHDSILSNFFVNAMTKNTEHDHYLLFRSENNRRVPLFFNELLCECCTPSINSTDIITNLIMLIISELVNVYEDEQSHNELMTPNATFIPILHYIESNFKNCTRESVSDIFHINEKSLTSFIKKNTGMTYKQLVQSQKLKYAAKLLRNTTMTITDVISESGYENASFFYQKFKDEFGLSPAEYRVRESHWNF